MEMEVPPEDEEELTLLLDEIPSNINKTAPCHQIKGHKRVFAEAWLCFLRMPLTEEMFKDILAIIRDQLFPNMADPCLLHGFLTETLIIWADTSAYSLYKVYLSS